MPQDTLKKLRADMEAMETRLVDKIASAPFRALMEKHGVVYGEDGSATMPDGVKILPDGTKQFPNAPTGPVVNTVPNTTPALPKEFGQGAVVSFQGANWRVSVVGDGIFRCVRFDEDGDRLETPFLYPRDVVLVTPAP